jgi:hypothetical protein
MVGWRGEVLMSKAKSAVPPPQEKWTVNGRTRDKKGRFVPGDVGNKAGRPKLREEFKAFAREKSLEALQVVYGIMVDAETSGRDRTAAARLLMEYGYGRPAAEYDRERLDLEIRRVDSDISRNNAGPQVIEVVWGDDTEDYSK